MYTYCGRSFARSKMMEVSIEVSQVSLMMLTTVTSGYTIVVRQTCKLLLSARNNEQTNI